MVSIAQFVTSLEPGRAKWMLICYEKFTIQNEVKMEKREYDDKIFNQKLTQSCGIDCVKEQLLSACFMSYMAGTTGLRGGDAGYGGKAIVTFRFDDGSNIYASASDIGFGKGAMERHPDTVDCADDDPEGKGVSIVAEGDAEILLLVTALERCANFLKRQISAKTDLDDGVNYANSMSWYRNNRKRRKAKNAKVTEQPPVEPVNPVEQVNPDETEQEEFDATQWEIIKKVETAHALSFCKLANQNEVENGQLDRNVCDGERQHAERIPTDAEGEPGA